MEKEIEIRRRTIARQIESAMTRAGMSRSALAAALGKKPSVITEWLSGRHNFTSDLLAQISFVLGTDITGVEGYEIPSHHTLEDPSASLYSIDNISLKPVEYRSLEMQSKAIGVSLRSYAELILAREARKHPVVEKDAEVQKTSAFLATCLGAWEGDDFDSVEESLSTMRTMREVKPL